MALKVMISAPYMQPAMDRFRPEFEERDIELVIPDVTERLDEEELLKLVCDIDGAICGDDQFTARVLDAAPGLKVISKWGTGIDSIDLVACKERNIAVCNTPNAFSEPVADSVLGYVLCFARKLPWMDGGIKKGIWSKLPSIALNECTIGIIGVGNVGKAIARRVPAFGARLLGNDIVEMPEDFLNETGISMVPLEKLLKESDFISVNCDLNPTSLHLLGGKAFAIMKPMAIVMNTARGPIIDEAALIDALETGRIAGAALDVFEEEPLPEDSPLRKMGNVMLAPHNANSSPQAWEKVHRSTLDSLFSELFKGE